MTALELEVQSRMDAAIDRVLDVIEEAAGAGVDIDPLSTIMQRLQARGTELDLGEMNPVMRMLLGGMTG